MIIDELYSVLPRPDRPIDTGTENDWMAVNRALGLRPPEDYVYFIKSYGTGAINDFLWVLNPFATNPNLNLLREVPSLLFGLRELREKYPDDFPYPLYFEPGGLLPWGTSIDGDIFCWLTRGVTGRWTTVTIPRHSTVEHFDGPMTTFLALAITGRLQSEAIPNGFASAEPRFTPADRVYE